MCESTAACAYLMGEFKRRVIAACAFQLIQTTVLAATLGAFDMCAVQEATAVCADYGIMLMLILCSLGWRIHRQVTGRSS